MFKNIDIKYQWNKETFLLASKAMYDFDMKHSPKRFLGWMFIALTQFGVVGALKKDAFGLLIVSTFLVIYWYALRWPLRKIMLLKGFNNSSIKDKQFVMSANKDGLALDSKLITWNDLKEVISLKDGFLLYYGESFLFIPKNAFLSIDEKDRFSHLAKDNAAFYKKDY